MGKLGGKLSMQVKKLKHKPWLSYCMLSSLVWLLTIFAMPAYSASKTVLVLGDSLSAEYGLARGKGWVSLLENQLLSAKIDAKVINASISGETTAGGKTRLAALLQQHKPTILIIELGGNEYNFKYDLNAFAELEDTCGNISEVLTKMEQGSAKAIRALVWAGLLNNENCPTEKEVGKMINLGDMADISNKIQEAIVASMPEQNPNE
jgi:lysophospholipase L1-like esterase